MVKVRAVAVAAGLAAVAGAGFVGASVSGATPAPTRLVMAPVPLAAPASPSATSPPNTAQPLPEPIIGAGIVPVAPPPVAGVVTRPVVDIEGCVLTGVYELSSPVPSGIQALYVDPANAGGPAAALRGDVSAVAVADPEIEAAATGATYSVWETPGAEPLILGAKRMSESDVGALSASVEGARSALPADLTPVAPAFSGAMVYGSACELDGEFYAVEVVDGPLADRAWWLLNTDPVASSDAGDVTTARYSNSGVTDFPVRQATESEWASYQAELTLPETAATAQGGLDG